MNKLKRNLSLILFLSALAVPFSITQPFSETFHITSVFGEYRGNYYHMGIDLVPENESDTPIRAIAGGKVVRLKNSRSGYGRALYVMDDGGNMYVYAHMSAFSDKIKEGYQLPEWRDSGRLYYDTSFETPPFCVNEGEVIGYLGDAGSGTGAHLHLEIRKYGDICFDPMVLQPGIVEDSTPPELCDYIYANYKGRNFVLFGIYDPATARNNRFTVRSLDWGNAKYCAPEIISYSEYRQGGDVYDTVLSSYSCYYYHFETDIPAEERELEVADHFGNTSTFILSPPDEIIASNTLYDGKNKRSKEIPTVAEKIRGVKIVSNKAGLYLKDLSKGKGEEIKFSIGPGFMGSDAFLCIRLNLKKKYALYRLNSSGVPAFYSSSGKVDLYPGEYTVLKDRDAPSITSSKGVFISDKLSGIDLSSLKVKEKGRKMKIERDYDILPSGELVLYSQAIDPNKDLIIKVRDRVGNKTRKKIAQREIKSFTNPF